MIDINVQAFYANHDLMRGKPVRDNNGLIYEDLYMTEDVPFTALASAVERVVNRAIAAVALDNFKVSISFIKED